MNFLSSVRSYFTDFLSVIYPPTCLGCDKIIPESAGDPMICRVCFNSLKSIPDGYVQKRILDRIEDLYLDELFIAVQFNETVKNLIHHIKYQKMNRLASETAQILKPFYQDSGFFYEADCVIPIPLHPAREKERGYNQSHHIALGLFDDRKMIVKNNLLVRHVNTPSQTQLKREQRRENVHGAFRLNDPSGVRGKNIVLVDDVATTGATLNECARVLKTIGAAKVVAATLSTPVD